MATDPSIRQISRDQLFQVFKSWELVKLFETILFAVRDTLPSGVEVVQEALDAHIADPVAAHQASAIENVPAGTVAATTVQGAVNELDANVQTVSAGLAAHIADAVNAHTASAIGVTPAGLVTSTDVQSALQEVAAANAVYYRRFMLMGA